jgi:hypothetical protein
MSDFENVEHIMIFYIKNTKSGESGTLLFSYIGRRQMEQAAAELKNLTADQMFEEFANDKQKRTGWVFMTLQEVTAARDEIFGRKGSPQISRPKDAIVH